MTVITAAMVKDLRERTGQPMMDCKKALAQTDGDLEKAIDVLRKQGMAVMAKRSRRETTEGRVVGKVAADGARAVLAMLCSETDFTAKNDEFGAAAEALAEALLNAQTAPETPQALGELDSGNGKKIAEIVNQIVVRTGEKVSIGEFVRFELHGPGLLFCYVHFNAKIGTLVHIGADNADAAQADLVKTLASDLAMHVTAVNPLAVSCRDIPAETLSREREIAAAQVKDKPANIIDKIVDGKMNKWFQQNVLLEQPFVKDDSKTVGQLIDEVGKAAGGQFSVKRFARLQIG